MESMKKLLFVLAFVGVASFASAQTTDVPQKKYSVATNSFWGNWFITAGGDYTVFYSDEQHGKGFNQSPFKDFRRDGGFGVGIGKWFTPGIGLRTKFNGVWGKGVDSESSSINKTYMKNYWTVNEQVMFNLSNLLCGYNASRVWNFIPYLGAGVVRNCTADIYAMDWNAGIMNTWRLGKHLDLFLDLSVVKAEPKMDGISEHSTSTASFKNYDQIYSAEIGLKFNLGKSTWEKTPDVDALMAMNKEQMDALNASLRDAQSENDRLKSLLASKKEGTTQTVVKKELATTKQSVFFNLNSSRIASRKDLVNVKEVAEYAKANGNKIVVTGYADSKTGRAAYNEKLSQRRANTVANELVKMGVSRDNIITKAAGGVNDLSPISYNRRATVELQ